MKADARSPKPTRAERQRRYRRRKRDGLAVFKVTAGCEVLEALRRKAIADGATPVEADKEINNTTAVNEALSQLCQEWACQYLKR
jgi:hypothetical protein